VARDDAQIDEYLGDRGARHGTPAIRMQGELPGCDPVRGMGRSDEGRGQISRFALGKHPPNHIATIPIDDDIPVLGGPGDWPVQLRDIPTPALVGTRGQERGRGVGGSASPIPLACDVTGGTQDALHGRPRTAIPARIKHGGIHLAERAIHNALALQDRPHLDALLGAQGLRRAACRRGRAERRHSRLDGGAGRFRIHRPGRGWDPIR